MAVCAKSSIITVMREGEERAFRTETAIKGDLRAPVLRGEPVGTLRVYEGGVLVGETELVAANSVASKDYGFWWRLLASLFAA